MFKVILHDIKRKNLPELDDEFAKDVSEFDTLVEYKEELEKRLQERKEKDSEAALETAVVEKAAANAEVEIPASMVEAELDVMVKEFERRLRSQGMTLEIYLPVLRSKRERLKEQMREDADKRVRNNLVLEAIAAAEKITVSDEEVDAELEKYAQSYQKSTAELRELFASNGALKVLKQ